MAYQAVEVTSPIVGGANRLSIVRDLDGVLYVAFYDSAIGTPATRIYTSTDQGGTWAAESWSQAVGAPTNQGGDDPVLVVDPGNVKWLVMSRYDGTDSPHVISRDPTSQEWGDPLSIGTGFARLTNNTGVAGFHAALNTAAPLPTVGVWDIVGVYVHSGSVVASYLQGGGDETVSSTGTPSGPKIAITPGGTSFCAWVESSVAYWSSEASKGSWSARAQLSTGGHTVQTIEDVAIKPNGLDYGVLYRHDATGTSQLRLAEYSVSDATWTVDRVWDESNNWNVYAGCSLQYDEQGGVLVAAPVDHDAAGTAELYTFDKVNGATTWTGLQRTSSSGGDIADTAAIHSHAPNSNGFKPQVFYQAGAFVTFIWPNGATSAQQQIVWINRDTYPGETAYPTIFSQVKGDLPYRTLATQTRTTISLAGEGSSGSSFPTLLPDFEYSESKIFQTSHVEFEAGYGATIKRFPSGRRIFSLRFDRLQTSNKDSLQTFIEARLEDLTPFTFTLPDTSESVTVFFVRGTERIDKVGPGVFAFSFDLMEVL